MSFHKNLFIFTHKVFDKRFMQLYQQLMGNLSKSYGELLEEQDPLLRKSIKFAYDQVPYYKNLFTQLKLHPEDIQHRKDLEVLPILTKQEIKDKFDQFIPLNLAEQKYFNNVTSGSTGNPLKYRFSKFDRLLGGCLVYRGWSLAGYELGDKMAFLAGSSLGINVKSKLIKKFHETTRNIKKLSSFDMTEENLHKYRDVINTHKPKFIRGYVSSIYWYALWLEENQLSIFSPQAVLTTAEKLFPYMRRKISKVFNCPVFDGYGLNDGGISAYELADHSGMRIDTERSILEVIDDNGNQLEEGTGRIIATSLYNDAFPFIRYDTGDIGTKVINPDGTHVLTEILGRQEEMLQTPEGKIIHGVYFGYIFREMDGIRNYQVIQKDLDHLTIRIVRDENFDKSQLDEITKFVRQRSEKWQLNYEFVEEIEATEAGKYKYVINLLRSSDTK